MFGRLTTVRLKTAEDAFGDGRIDEAFEIVSAPDLADHRRAQRLLSKLVKRFLNRGQEHLMNQRFAEALADFERAGRCGSQRDKVAEWRDRTIKAMVEAEDAARDKAAALAEAKQHLATGSLGGAEAAIGGVSVGDPDRQELAEAIGRQSDRAAELLDEARATLKRAGAAAALVPFRKAWDLHPRMAGMADLESRLVRQVVDQVAASFKDGRLDRVEQELAVLGEVGQSRSERLDIEEALRMARDAAKAVVDGRYARADVLLGRLLKIGPKAGWVSEARKHIEALEDNRRTLLEGPLGLSCGRDVPSLIGVGGAPMDETLPAMPKPAAPPKIVKDDGDAGRALPRRMILRIDGVGSYLLLPRERISIGRAGPGATADLQLVSDLSDRQAEIVRSGDDYFVMASSGVELAGRPVEHALLQEGDRVRLGRRIRLKFRRASQKSTTAALDLGEGVRTTTDVRRVILWGGPILIGGRRECHIQLRHTADGVVLVRRGGEMFVKPMIPGGRSVLVALGQPFDAAGVRASVQEWTGLSGTGRVIG